MPVRIKRAVSGIVLLDKPSGITSNNALQRVKRLFNADKAGHTGSLDPLASGLLPICLGEATKISSYLLDADKAYITDARLGVTTDSGDADGRVLETRAVPPLSEAAIDAILDRFRGDILQVPPMHSALKQGGQPLYKLAHRGITVDRAARPVTIFELRREALAPPVLRLYVRCSKGTYIRTLVEDIGLALGCGAHVATLRRVEVGALRLADAYTLDQLQELAAKGQDTLDQVLLPLEHGLAHWPRWTLDESSARRFKLGQAVLLEGIAPGARGLACGPSGEPLGMAEFRTDRGLAPLRIFNLPLSEGDKSSE